MNKKELKLFLQKDNSLKTKFILLMSKLTINQSDGFENLLFIFLSTLQNISIYFSKKVGVLDIDNNILDKILNGLERIIRFKSLVFNNHKYYSLSIYLLFSYYFFYFIFFIILLYNSNRKTTYNSFLKICNFLIKLNIYLFSNVSLDLFTHMICFNKEYNYYIPEIKCNQSNNILPFIISILTLFFSQFFMIFIHYFYEDNLFISNSTLNCLSSNIIIFQHVNEIISSFTLGCIEEIHHGFFFLINCILSSIIFIYYLKRLIYYNEITNFILGLSFCINVYSSIYFFIFYYIDMSQKGLIFILSSIFVAIFFKKLLSFFIEKIIKETPYHKIKNKYYVLFYVKYLMNLIQSSSENPEAKSLLIGLMEIHAIECPNSNCLTKTKEKIYLPLEDTWSDRSKPFILDKIFLKYFIVVIISYYVKIEYYIPELIINLSHYYLEVIGNICLSIYYFEKVKKMKLTFKEEYLLERLKMIISYKLYENLKEENESCPELADLNTTFFYKYNSIAKRFTKEIYNDLELSINFWENFSSRKNMDLIDINHVIKVIEKVDNSKNLIKYLWKEMFKIYSGINTYFLLYLDYINEINDDAKLKNELENYKKKKENSTENIIENYYNLLFKKETGIIIVNGDRGKEGIIEKVNYAFGNIFHLNSEKMRGKNINEFMPKIFSDVHNLVMKRYFDIGKKKIIDKGNFKVFGLDKNNSIIQLQKNIKIFPMLNDYLYYIGMFSLEKIEDIILINNDFIIQGMSKKLLDKLKITNDNLFIENEIPFYMICKNFINFYKTFFKSYKTKKKKQIKNSFLSSGGIYDNEEKENLLKDIFESDTIITHESNHRNNLNNSNITLDKIDDINENMEIEYEIKFPQFLSKYSYHTKNKVNEIESSSSVNIDDSSLTPVENNEVSLMNNEQSLINNETSIINNETSIINQEGTLINNEINSYNAIINEENDDKKDDDSPLINRYINHKKTKNSSFYKTSCSCLVNKINHGNTHEVHFNNPSYTPSSVVFYDYTTNVQKNGIKKFYNIQIDSKRKINLYKNLFVQGKFKELEMLFDRDSFDGSIDFKFNFSFEKYFYDDGKICFIIRCIDTKLDNDEDSEKETSHVNFTTIKLKKTHVFNLKNVTEINYNEYNIFLNNIVNFQYLSKTNLELKNLLQRKFRDFQSKSRVHGKKINDSTQLLDENSSQTGATSYNSNLSKLNKIIEARNNLLQNVSNFYTLKYFNIISTIWLLTTITFSIVFIINLYDIGNQLLKVRYADSVIFKMQIQIMNMLNTLLDYIAYYNNNNLNKKYNLNFGFSSIDDFLDYTISNITYWYNKGSFYLNYVERNLIKYIKNSKQYFWAKIKINYHINIPIEDEEYFPLITSASIYNAYYLFTNPLNNLTDDKIENTNYAIYMAIHEMNLNILPIVFSFIPSILNGFINFNNHQFYIVKKNIIILIFALLILGIWFFYIVFITKKYLAVGIQKVSKINQESISNIIKNINNFKNVVKSRFKLEETEQKAIKSKSFFTEKSKTKTEEEGLVLNDEKSRIEQNFLFEPQKFKKLKFQTFIIVYFLSNIIVILLLLYFLYYLPKSIISDNKNFIKSEAFILQNFLYTSVRLYKLKCIILNFPSVNKLNISSIIDYSLTDILFQSIKKSKKFYDFYYNGFKLNACYALYEKTNPKYDECLNSDLPKEFNSTEAFKQFILKKIIMLEYILFFNVENIENYDTLEIMSKDDYSHALIIYQFYYISVFERFEDTIENILGNEINNVKKKCIIICCILTIWVICNILYMILYIKKYFKRMLLVSKSFIQIIPTNLIFNTPDLEVWLEKMEKS